jgi:hypothetical protein
MTVADIYGADDDRTSLKLPADLTVRAPPPRATPMRAHEAAVFERARGASHPAGFFLCKELDALGIRPDGRGVSRR